MKTCPTASVILLSLAAASAGCGDSQDGYVNYENTPPASRDQKEVEEETASLTVPLQPTPTPVIAASASDHSGSSEVERAVSSDSNTDSTTIDSGASSELPPAVSPESLPTTGDVTAKSSETVVSAQSGLSGPADVPVVENTTTTEPRKIELLIPDKHFRKERGSNALRISYDDIDLLKVLNMEPVPLDATDHFPEWLKSLNGKPIRIRGFMYPTFEATGLTGFTLARDNGICCFVRQPKIYDIIGVTLADGVTTDYIEGRPFDVEGIFRVDPKADEKDLARLYRIENATVVH